MTEGTRKRLRVSDGSEPVRIKKIEVSETPEREVAEMDSEIQRAVEDLACRKRLETSEAERSSAEAKLWETLWYLEDFEGRPLDEKLERVIDRVEMWYPRAEERAEPEQAESGDTVQTTLEGQISYANRILHEAEKQREQVETQHETEDVHAKINDQMKTGFAEQDHSIKELVPQEIPEDLVDKFLEPLRSSESVDVKTVVDAIDDLVSNTSDMESRVRIGNLSQLEIERARLEEIKDILEENWDSVKGALNERSEDKIRVGIVKEKLYIWTPDENPNDMINGWRTQYFYMDSKNLSSMIEEVDSRLELDDACDKNYANFNRLVRQLTSDGKYKQFNITEKQSRITGESLSFVRDVTGIESENLEEMIHKVTGANGHGGIKNPKLHEGQKLEVLRARLMATAVSDCYVRPDGILDYYEENLERIERFKDETLRGFGDFFKEPRYMKQHGYYRLKISSPYGRALNEWGIPSGNRTILNYGLPRETENWSRESIMAYLQDLISEEGHIAKGKIRWQRSNALRAGKKDGDYDFEPKITQSEVELIKSKRQEYSGEYEGEYTLRWNNLKDLRYSKDTEIAAKARKLHGIIRENRNRLIDDEGKLAERLGIEVVIEPEEVVYYENSGRVSVKWEARTRGVKPMIRWAMICPPNHPEKEVALKKWLSERKAEDVRRVLDDLEKEGFETELEGF